jgi:hypothetical protein
MRMGEIMGGGGGGVGSWVLNKGNGWLSGQRAGPKTGISETNFSIWCEVGDTLRKFFYSLHSSFTYNKLFKLVSNFFRKFPTFMQLYNHRPVSSLFVKYFRNRLLYSWVMLCIPREKFA